MNTTMLTSSFLQSRINQVFDADQETNNKNNTAKSLEIVSNLYAINIDKDWSNNISHANITASNSLISSDLL